MSDAPQSIDIDVSCELVAAASAMRAQCCDRAADAIAQIRAAARAGDVAAQTILGSIHCEGRGIAIDATEGAFWYALAASSGDAEAMNLLGRCHELGHGVPVNFELAAAWYREAAGAGLDWGMYNLALLLFHGRGSGIDRAAALAWFRRAADTGHAKSINWVGRFYDEGWIVAADSECAFDCYRRAAQAGDFRGQASYASRLVTRGRIDQAIIWLRRSLAAATAAFRERLLDDLASSPHAALRALAREGVESVASAR